MSVLTAVFQAIAQAVTWLLLTSESAYSSIFHDFTNQLSGECSALTGIIHIGIALGAAAASFKIFATNAREFVMTFVELFGKKKPFKNPTHKREFVYMTVLSFLPMILWAFPAGKYGTVYNLLRSGGFNGNILDDGLLLIFTGALLLLAHRQCEVNPGKKRVSAVCALVAGFACVLAFPVSGLSPVVCIICVLILFGVTNKLSFRYCVSVAVPALLVIGIVQTATAAVSATAVQVIIGLLLSAVSAFFCTRVLKYLTEKAYFNYFGIYNIGVGVIAAVIGIFEFALR